MDINTIFRQPLNSDADSFDNLVTNQGGSSIIKATFGTFNFSSLLEYSLFNIAAFENYEDENLMTGFISVSDKYLFSNEPEDFEQALDLLRFYIPVNINNSLFLNFWLLDDTKVNHEDVGKNILLKCFEKFPTVDYIIWVCPKFFIPSMFVENNFTLLGAKVDSSDSNIPITDKTIYFAHRSSFLPTLLVRESRVEDNDDLLPILQVTHPDIMLGQEPYFLADLIQSQDENNKFFVGLKDQEICGMLSTSTEVNVNILNKVFDLDHLNDLIIMPEKSPLPPPLLVTIVGDIRLIDPRVLLESNIVKDFVFINLEEEDFLSGSDKHQSILQKVEHYLEQKKYSGAAHAYVLYGLPRNESEATSLMDHLLNEFDYIVEILNEAEDADDDDDDEFLQQHLDGIEVIREKYFDQEKKGKKENHFKVDWSKVSVDSESSTNYDNSNTLIDELSKIIDRRLSKIEAQRAKENEIPLKANAFAVTLFSMKNDFNSRGQDLLKYAFEIHQSCDYCLFMVAGSNFPSDELVQPMTFIKSKPGISFDQSLFIMHRSYFLGRDYLKVERLTNEYLGALEEYISPLNNIRRNEIYGNAIKSIQNNDMELKENPSEVCFLVKVGKNIVGMVDLSRKILSSEDFNWIRLNYEIESLFNLDKHRVRSQAVICNWLIDPIFSKWSRHIIREVMRQYRKSLLYFQSDYDVSPPKEIVEEFAPIRPRRLVKFSYSHVERIHQRPGKEFGAPDNRSPLFCITKSYLQKSRSIVPNRLVIMGGSSHSYALVENLCSIPDLYFPNIYFVLDRMPEPFKINHQSDEFHKEDHLSDESLSGLFSLEDVDYPSSQELYAHGFPHKLNLITGHLTDIDRENKAIVISDEIALEYDTLVISTPTQDCTFKKIPTLSKLHPLRCADAGVFGLGNYFSDQLAYRWIQNRMSSSKSSNIVLFGKTLKLLAAWVSLKSIGIDPSKIILLSEENYDSVEGINSHECLDQLLSSLEEENIRINWNVAVPSINLSRSGFVQSINITDPGQRSQTKTIQCIALLFCSREFVDMDVFNAISDSGLVFDGGLVVDTNFKTVDPYIYSFCDFTRFSRVHRKAIEHKRFNPREMAAYFSIKYLEHHLSSVQINLLFNQFALTPQNSQLPEFSMPRAYTSKMPGNLKYFRAVLPKMPEEFSELPTSSILNGDKNFNKSNSKRSSCLQIDNLGIVTLFEYVGEEEFNPRNLALIPGKHEAYLNSAVHSFNKGFVLDWVEYFSADWAAAIFHEKFPNFIRSLRSQLSIDKGMLMILSRIYEHADNSPDDNELQDFRRELVGPYCEEGPITTKKLIVSETMEFVKRNKNDLQTYYE